METGASWATNSLTTRTVAGRAICNLSRRAAGVSFDRCAGWERFSGQSARRRRLYPRPAAPPDRSAPVQVPRSSTTHTADRSRNVAAINLGAKASPAAPSMLRVLARTRAVAARGSARTLYKGEAGSVIRPVGVFAGETGLPGPDPAGAAALQNFVNGMPANFVTDISYRLAAFVAADKNGDKSIDLDELKEILVELHPSATAEDAAALLAAADENGDGVLQSDEFMRLFESGAACVMRQRLDRED
mmetsp:Transcript_5325/g.16529  ORF Transcript_5325/g.16529 Transcript_5325/m.16529 type:complete len:246 (+) Transcript_5325:99-836(+)